MQIQLTLLSDTIVGSGEGLAGIIDRDIVFDDYGFPYIPAKRIKGVLRESALEFCELVGKKAVCSAFERLFGKGGEQFSKSLKFGNGYLENYRELHETMDALDEKYRQFLPPESLHEWYSYTRAQTTINPKTGTAKEDTLRVSRVLKKKVADSQMTFRFEIFRRTELSETEKDLLDKACKLTRHIGLSRTRGFGEVKLEFIPDSTTHAEEQQEKREEKKEKTITFQTEMSDKTIYCLPYRITTLSQTICSSLVDGNNTVSDQYIPGSHLLGFFAGTYIRKFPILKFDNTYTDKPSRLEADNAYEDRAFRRLFLEGDVHFLHAYLIDEETKIRQLPTPVSIIYQKDTEELYNLAYPADYTKVQQNDIQTQKLLGKQSFCVIEQSEIRGKNPEQEAEYHHARPEDRSIGHATLDRGGEFYQYEVLKQRQEFEGWIIGNKADLENLRKLVPNESRISVGKSRTAQYGQATITYKDITIFDGEFIKTMTILPHQKEFVVTLTSPMILMNKYGHYYPDPELFVEELRERTGRNDIALKSQGAWLRFVKIGGFLAKWGLPCQQAMALDAGSVLVVTHEGEQIDIAAMQRKGYGLRTEQGYGRVVVKWHGETTIQFAPSPTGLQDEEDELPDFPEPFKQIAVTILEKRLESAIKGVAIKEFEEKLEAGNKHRKIMTSSLIGRLKTIVQNSKVLADIPAGIDKIAKDKQEDIANVLQDWIREFCGEDREKAVQKILNGTEDHKNQELQTLKQALEYNDEVFILGNEQKMLDMVKLFLITILTHCELHNRRI